jgi:hypothetical protein
MWAISGQNEQMSASDQRKRCGGRAYQPPGHAHKSITALDLDKKSYFLLIWINLKAARDR